MDPSPPTSSAAVRQRWGTACSPSLLLCCTGLYPHYPLNDSLPIIIWLLLFLMTNSGSSGSLDRKFLPPVSCPAIGKGFFFFPGIKKKDHFKCRVFFFKHSFSASLSSVCYFTADGLSLETNSSGCDTDNFPPPQEKEKPGRAGGKLGCGAAQPQSGEQLCTSSHPILCTSHPEVCKLSSRKNKAKITD